MKTWLTLLVLLGAFSGCNSSVQTSVDNSDIKSEVFSKGETMMQQHPSTTILKRGEYPMNTQGKQERHIYHSDMAKDVAAFQRDYLALTDEEAPVFKGTMIIAKMGERMSGGYSIDVSSVKDADRFIEVTFLSKSPTGLATMAITNPFIIVYIEDDFRDVKILEK